MKCRILSQVKHHSSTLGVSTQSSDVWIALCEPAGRLLGSGKQLNTQVESIHCTELYWSITVAEGGERRKEQSYAPPCQTALIAEQIMGEESNGLLGADAFTVSWEERKLEKKRDKEQKTQGVTDGVQRYIQTQFPEVL